MPYVIAAVFIVIFTVNVVMGAIGGGSFFNSVVEMLVLFAAAISFSVGILRSEARAKAAKDQ